MSNHSHGHCGCQLHVASVCMHASVPVEPSSQIGAISGIGPQPSAIAHGVVLAGGTQSIVQTQAAPFSLPQLSA